MKWLINTLRAWFTKPDSPDVPDFVVCTCVAVTGFDNSNPTRTVALTNPRCPLHSAAGRQT